jgi:NitT/TauT family transport system permease protein
MDVRTARPPAGPATEDRGPTTTEPEAADPGPAILEPESTVPAPGRTDPVPGALVVSGTRGRRPSALLGIRSPISGRWRIAFGVLGVAAILGLWFFVSARLGSGSAVVPSPGRTLSALGKLWSDGTLQTDLWASLRRIAIGYSISVAFGVVIGLSIGTFASVEAFLEPQFGFLRYIPATALTPVFMLWLGIDESPKVWLIVAGTVFFNILMVADVARAVPRELINASYTLGAGRGTIMRKVILPHSVPGIIDVARINLAAAWLMLVVAELLAAQSGLAYQIIRAQRFRAVDVMFAILIVFGVIGLVSDLFLRWLRDRVAPWSRP